jgi:hypothetical protein
MNDTRVLFNSVKVFDGTGTSPYDAQVLVVDESISAVAGPGQSRLDVENARVIDGQGTTLMPGLVEAHAHLTWPSSVERVINAMKLPIEEHMLGTAQNARITIDHGFTSAYSAGSLGERFEVALRDMIDGGHLPGPRLRASALERGAEDVMGVPAAHDPSHDRDIPGLRAYVKSMKDLGCDTIKFLMSSDEGFAAGGAQQLLYTESEAQAIGEAALERGHLACLSCAGGRSREARPSRRFSGDFSGGDYGFPYNPIGPCRDERRAFPSHRRAWAAISQRGHQAPSGVRGKLCYYTHATEDISHCRRRRSPSGEGARAGR